MSHMLSDSRPGVARNVIVCFLIILMLGSCGNKAAKENPTSQTSRTSYGLPLVEPKYIDESASVSQDGIRLLFTSGRDGGVRRIYKTQWSGTAWSAPERLAATSGMTEEWLARLSPDGARALVYGSNYLGDVLSMCDVSAGTCTVVASSPKSANSFGFSPDSAMFFYLKDEGDPAATLYVSMTSDPAAALKVGDTGEWREAFWTGDPTATYALVAARQSKVNGKKTLIKRTFNTPAASAVSALETSLGPDLTSASAVDPGSASTLRFTMLLPSVTTTDKKFDELGSYSGTDKRSHTVLRRVHSWLVNGTDEGALATPIGVDTDFARMTADHATIFTRNHIAIRCAGDVDSTWGYSMAVVNRVDGAVVWRHVKKPIDLSQAPSFTEDPCDRAIDGVATSLDLTVRDTVVNRAATAANHTLVWTSSMTGDSEVYAAISNGGTVTIYNVSGNRKP